MKDDLLNHLYVLERDVLDGIDVREEISMLLSSIDRSGTRRLQQHLQTSRERLISKHRPDAHRELRRAIQEVKRWEE